MEARDIFEKDDWEIDIPTDYWLSSSNLKYLLAVMVCRGYKDLCPNPTHLAAGGTRTSIRASAAQRTVVERDAARTTAESRDTVNAELATRAKRAKLSMGNEAIDFQKIQNVREQITILKEMKDTMVGAVGEEVYQDRMFALTSSLPGWGDFVTPLPGTEAAATNTTAVGANNATAAEANNATAASTPTRAPGNETAAPTPTRARARTPLRDPVGVLQRTQIRQTRTEAAATNATAAEATNAAASTPTRAPGNATAAPTRARARTLPTAGVCWDTWYPETTYTWRCSSRV